MRHNLDFGLPLCVPPCGLGQGFWIAEFVTGISSVLRGSLFINTFSDYIGKICLKTIKKLIKLLKNGISLL